MANKRLGTAAAELKLPTKKDKTSKKPKWQAKIGGKKGKELMVAASAHTPRPSHQKRP